MICLHRCVYVWRYLCVGRLAMWGNTCETRVCLIHRWEAQVCGDTHVRPMCVSRHRQVVNTNEQLIQNGCHGATDAMLAGTYVRPQRGGVRRSEGRRVPGCSEHVCVGVGRFNCLWKHFRHVCLQKCAVWTDWGSFGVNVICSGRFRDQ